VFAHISPILPKVKKFIHEPTVTRNGTRVWSDVVFVGDPETVYHVVGRVANEKVQWVKIERLRALRSV
jgi:hypothetical protein